VSRSTLRLRRRRCLTLALACVASLTVPAASEAVAAPFLRGFDENLYRSSEAEIRERWFDESVEAGANIARIGASWRHVVTGAPPADPRDPADPAYDFALVDAQVRESKSRGLDVLLTVNGAPTWAEGPDRPNSIEPGAWKPDPIAFGAFGEALARRYSGSFADESGPLPPVRYFEAWNEPNQNDFLAPQWVNRQPFAPDHYRKMLNAFYEGVHRSNSSAKVMGPGTSPFGDPGRTGSRMRPLFFIREVLCLTDRNGRSAPDCREPAHLDIVSHHPINLAGTHRDSALHPDDVVIGDMDELKDTIRFAERAGTLVPRRRHPVWVSELWWLTKPPHPFGVSPAKQASYIQGSFYELWRQGVDALLWYQLADDTDFQSGLFTQSEKPKPGLTAFRFPFVTRPAQGKAARCWGIPPSTGTLAIQRKQGRGWRTIKRLSVKEDVPFQVRVRTRGEALLRATLNEDHSLPSEQDR
jgi:hypothetical protein